MSCRSLAISSSDGVASALAPVVEVPGGPDALAGMQQGVEVVAKLGQVGRVGPEMAAAQAAERAGSSAGLDVGRLGAQSDLRSPSSAPRWAFERLALGADRADGNRRLAGDETGLDAASGAPDWVLHRRSPMKQPGGGEPGSGDRVSGLAHMAGRMEHPHETI